MTELLNNYMKLIMEERFWSWSVIGILYLIAGSTVRGWFLNGVSARARALKSKYYHEVKQAYLRRSLPGWFLFFLPLVIFTFVWNQTATRPLAGIYLAALIVGGVSFLGSILAHLNAFAFAALTVLGDIVQDKEHEAVLKSHP